MSDQAPEQTEHPGRWQLLRDVLAFQFKLAMDGLRDVLLSPISITAALIGIFSDRHNPGRYFYTLLELGHRSDRWINLFGRYDHETDEPSADGIIKSAEQRVLDHYSKGGVVSQIKDRTDKAIDTLHDRRDPT